MLKITIHDSPESIRLQLEGKLAGDWVQELERCWLRVRSTTQGRKIIVDLTDNDFVDENGIRLLATMHKDGAGFVAVTPLMIGVVAELTELCIGPPSRRCISGIVALLVSVAASAAIASAQPSPAARRPMRLSLGRAVQLAIAPEGNAHLQLADEAVTQARSRSAQARAALLPNLEAMVGQQSQTRNLEAVGIRFNSPIPGVEFPKFVGPFNVFDVRASVTQTIFDFSAIRRYSASKAGVDSALSERSNTQDVVTARVAKAYLASLRAEAEMEAVQANVVLAQAVFQQSQNQKNIGTGTGIEVTRARVQLSNEQQRLLVAGNERRRTRLQLLREVGLRLDTDVELTDTLTYNPVEQIAPEAAKREALKSRADLKAQQERENTARISSSATAMERLPSIVGFADYGAIGSSVNNALPTRTFGASVRIPLFDGGRRDARRGESASQYRQEQVRTNDLREQIELEVRVALDAIASAEQQFKVASDGLVLAENELNQARRRFEAGVATGLEVTDAQTRLARARDNRIDALFNHNVARVDLAQAQGVIGRLIQ